MINAIIGPLAWPIDLHTLQNESEIGQDIRVYALEIDGHIATDILRFVTPSGRQIVYVPGDSEAFHVLDTPTDLHWWALQQLNEKAPRELFLQHFSLADRQSMAENISDLMNRLVSTWGHSDHSLVNQTSHAVTTDIFSWLRESVRHAMFAEADLALTSNGDLRKKL